MKNRKKMYIPWIIFEVYMAVVLIISLFGPWEYKGFDIKSRIIVFLYIVLFMIITAIMYYLGINVKHRRIYSNLCLNKGKNAMLFLKINIVVAILLVTGMCITEIGNVDFSNISLNNIGESIALAYKNSHSDIVRTRSLANTCYILGYGMIQFTIIVGVYKLKELKAGWRITVFGVIGLLAFYNTFFIGSNRGILEIFIMIVGVYILKWGSSQKQLKKKYIFFIGIIAILAFIILSKLLFNRVVLWGSIQTSFYTETSQVNLDNWMVRYLPENMAYALCLGFSYLTQGIYGLSQCLKLPYVCCFGLGSSPAIRNLAAKFSFEIENITYPERLEQISEWKAGANWHTIFPWLASDFTFLGALIVMGIFAYIFAIVWREAIEEKDIFAIALFPNFLVMWGFVPANNQIFITTTTTIAFIYLIVLWLFFRGKSKR